MQNDYYVFEDKKYEAAVRNLKATFFDIVFREEAMLKNLELRIGTEQNDVVRQQMLDLWTKQNESLDQTLGLVENLTNSVKVLDSFISELSSIDEKIVKDIINSANHYADNPKYQEQIEEPVREAPQNVQEEVPVDAVDTQTVEQEVTEGASEPKIEEVVQEEPQVVESEPVSTEEPVLIDVNQEVFGDNANIEANNEFDISPNGDEAFEPIEDKTSDGEATDEPVIIASEGESDVPEMEVVNEEHDGTDLPYVVEPDTIEGEEESSEEVTLNDEQVEIPSFDSEIVTSEENSENEETEVDGGPLIPLEDEVTEESFDDESDSDDSDTDGGLDLPFATDTEESEYVVSESTSNVPRLEKILRSNKDVQIKAIIVTSGQFNKLASSFGTQEALLFARGVLSEDIYKHSNSVLTTLIKSGGVNINFKKKEDDKEKQLRDSTATVIQDMLVKANNLYKNGRVEEAQKMYDAISEMSKTLQVEQAEEKTKQAPASAPVQQPAAAPAALAVPGVAPAATAVPQQAVPVSQ